MPDIFRILLCYTGEDGKQDRLYRICRSLYRIGRTRTRICRNIFKGWDWCSGYHYSDSIIIGFSHTHLSGTGCSDLGDILLMPYTGEVRTARGEQDNMEGAASSYYKHANEAVAPGYYSLLMDNGLKEELTAT